MTSNSNLPNSPISSLSSSYNMNLQTLNLYNISEISFNNNQELATGTGRPVSDVWLHFIKGREKVKGHYSASCKYCPITSNCGIPFKLKAHLANECPGCHYSISHFYLDEINNQQYNEMNRKQNAQTLLSNFYESIVLTDQRKNSIDKSLLQAFVCCGILLKIHFL
jgi:hypothetical protein